MLCEVIIPYRLKSVANTPEHWAKKANRVKKERGYVRLFLLPHILPYSVNQPKMIIVTLMRIAPRELDAMDNLRSSFKSIVDSISELYFPDAGRGRADSHHCFLWQYSQEKGKPKEYKVKIKIEEM